MNKTFNNSIDFVRIKQFIIKYLFSLGIFALTIILTPKFNIDSIYVFFLSSFCIIILDYFVSIITGIHDIPLGRGFVGFTSASIIIYITSYIVTGYNISIISSVIAALIYGFIDFMLPNK